MIMLVLHDEKAHFQPRRSMEPVLKLPPFSQIGLPNCLDYQVAAGLWDNDFAKVIS